MGSLGYRIVATGVKGQCTERACLPNCAGNGPASSEHMVRQDVPHSHDLVMRRCSQATTSRANSEGSMFPPDTTSTVGPSASFTPSISPSSMRR